MNMTKKEFAVFSAPSMVIMVILMIVPLVITIYFSFCTYKLGFAPQFVGLRNYYTLFAESPRLWSGTWFTLWLTLINVVVRLVLGLFFAMLLYSVKNKIFKAIIISGLLIPYAITPAVGTMMFSWLFKDVFGLFPYYLSMAGIDISWFSEPLAAQALVILHSIWSGVSFNIITFYSGLQAMPADPLKAAAVEGATAWQKLRYVIIPYLSPLAVFCTMTTIMAVFRTYDSVAVMTKGGPGISTETFEFYNYQVAFTQQSIGLGSAMSILSIFWIFLLMAPFLYIMYREQLDK